MAVITRTPNRRKSVATRWSATSIGADVLAFVLAGTASFSVRIVGDLPIAEIIQIPLVPILISAFGKRLLRPNIAVIFSLIGLWLVGQVLTDIYRGTPTIDWMRGDAAIVFFAIDIAGLTVLLARNERRKVIFLIGLAIGSLLSARFYPSRLSIGDPWKFGYSSGSALLVLLISSYFYSRRQYMISGVFLAGISGVNLLMNYRSQVLFLLITVALVFPIVPEQIGRLRLLPRAGGFMRVAVLAGIALGAGWAALSLVRFVTSAGLIGEEAVAKNEEQAETGGLLLAGRPEIQVSSRAVLDSPILGHGSWAKDFKYVEMLDDIRVEKGGQSELQDAEEESQGGVIPTHSHIMGAWVWAGILGAVFWAYFLWLVIQGTVRVTILRPPLAPIYAYIILGMMWSILFSPFSTMARFAEALTIVIIIDLLKDGGSSLKVLKWARRGQWRRQGFHARLSVPGRNPAVTSTGG